MSSRPGEERCVDSRGHFVGIWRCNNDLAMAERLGLTLTRTQTCMQGASHCDFRYRKRA